MYFSDAYNGCDIIFVSSPTTYKKPGFISLTSHEIDNIVVLVKNNLINDVEIKSQLIFSVPIMLALWTFLRKFFRIITNSPNPSLVRVALDTWGTFLGTNPAIHIKNRPERIMNLSILLLSILTTNLATAIIFNYLLGKQVQYGIDSLKELGDSGMEILISDELEVTMDEWSHNLKLINKSPSLASDVQL